MSKRPVGHVASPTLRSNSKIFSAIIWVISLTTLTVLPFTFDAFTTSKILILAVGMVLISFLIATGKNSKGWKVGLPLTFFMTTFLASIYLSWMLSGVPFTRGLLGQFGRGNGVLYYTLAIITVIYTAKYFNQFEVKKLHKTMTFLACVLCVYATFQKLGIDFAPMDTRGLSPLVLTLGNSNFSGSMLAVLFAFHFSNLVLMNKIRIHNLLLLFYLLVGVILSNAFQGYLIIAFAIFVSLSIVAIRKYGSTMTYLSLSLVWICGIALVILGLFGRTFMSQIFSRRTFQIRREYWNISMEMLRDHLWFGVGPDQFYDYSATYMAPGSLDLITATRLDNAHNWYLNIAVNFGIFAILSLLAILLIVVQYSMFLFTRKSNSNYGAISAGVALFCTILSGVVSIEQPGIGIWMYFLLGIVIAAHREAYIDKVSKNSSKIESGSNSRNNLTLGIYKWGVVVILVVLVFTPINRVQLDARLRSEIQRLAVQQTDLGSINRIVNLTVALRSEPEYSTISLNQISQYGLTNELEEISSATLDYNKNSIQAAWIRADVLRALGRKSESCEIRPKLLENSPWDFSLLQDFLVCRANSNLSSEKIEVLESAAEYIKDLDFKNYEPSFEKQGEILGAINRASVMGRLEFELGNLTKATRLANYATGLKSSLQTFIESTNDPANRVNWDEVESLLGYYSP